MYRYWRTAGFLVHCSTRSRAESSLNLYSDSSCQDLVITIEGKFLNFGCAVIVYGVNNAFCGLNDKWQATGCHANASISQFTIDCPATALASTPAGRVTGTTPSTFSTSITNPASTTAITTSSTNGPSNTTSTTQQLKASSSSLSGTGLSSNDKIALGVGIPSSFAALITIVAEVTALSKWYSNRKKRGRTQGQTGP